MNMAQKYGTLSMKMTKIVASAEGRTFTRTLHGPVSTDRYNQERKELQQLVRNMAPFTKHTYEECGWDWEE